MKNFSKRFLSILLSLIMVVALVPVSILPTFAVDGTITQDTDGYYMIYDKADLAAFAELVKTNKALNAKLMDNIEMGGTSISIGDAVTGPTESDPNFNVGFATLGINGYSGTFDGQGYTINNFVYQGTSEGAGSLFTYTDGATIKNLTVNGSITSNISGGIAAVARNTTFYRCAFNGLVNVINSYSTMSGGLIGQIRGNNTTPVTIEECYVTGLILPTYYPTQSGDSYYSHIGGIAGNRFYGYINIKNSFVAAYIGGATKAEGNGLRAATLCTNNGGGGNDVAHSMSNFYYVQFPGVDNNSYISWTKVFATKQGTQYDLSAGSVQGFVDTMNTAAGSTIWEAGTVNTINKLNANGTQKSPLDVANNGSADKTNDVTIASMTLSSMPTWKSEADGTIVATFKVYGEEVKQIKYTAETLAEAQAEAEEFVASYVAPEKQGYVFKGFPEFTLTAESVIIEALYEIEYISIYTLEDLKNFAKLVNDSPDLKGKLMNDIDMNGTSVQIGGTVLGPNVWNNATGSSTSWEDSYEATEGFKGEFDGNGYSINNFYYNGQGTCGSLFTYVNGGTIKNLTVNGSIRCNYAGGIVGTGKDITMINCAFNGVVNTPSSDATYSTMSGGLIAQVKGTANTISNSYVTGIVLPGYAAAGVSYSGGFVGQKREGSSLTIENSFVAAYFGEVGAANWQGKSGTFVGGTHGATLTNCYYTNYPVVGTNTLGTASKQGTQSSMAEYYSGKLVEKMNTAAGKEIWAMEITNTAMGFVPPASNNTITAAIVSARVPTWSNNVTEADLVDVSGALLELNGSINIVFLAAKDQFADSDVISLSIYKNGELVATLEKSEVELYPDYYAFRLSDIAAKNMGDSYQAILTVNDKVSRVVNYSVLQYAKNMLAKDSSSAELKDALVAMLNYGAAAQTHFEYNTGSLVNSTVGSYTSEGYTAILGRVDSIIAAGAGEAANGGIITGASLKLEGKVSIEFALNSNEYTVMAYTSEADANSMNQAKGIELTYVTDGTSYIYTIPDIYAIDLGTTYYVRVYSKSSVSLVDSIDYSAYDYAVAESDNEDADLAALVKALIAYGEATKAYFE